MKKKENKKSESKNQANVICNGLNMEQKIDEIFKYLITQGAVGVGGSFVYPPHMVYIYQGHTKITIRDIRCLEGVMKDLQGIINDYYMSKKKKTKFDDMHG